MIALSHLGIIVKNCELSARFYCENLGCTITGTMANEQLEVVNLQSGSLTIELLEYLETPSSIREAGALDHLAFAVSDIHAVIAELKEKGIAFLTDKPRDAMNGKKIIFFTGPDGERIELVEEKDMSL
ncbi:MAG: VOC family protein [Syntrophomonas sp.]|nr:VOC family protein [Syntrophomonas sp.]